MRTLTFVALLALQPYSSRAQSGFVITVQDSILHGYMRFVRDNNGNSKLLFTTDKKKAPRTFVLADLKYYALKKDTFAILRNFYAFDDEAQPVEVMEARVIVSKGRLKLYHGTLPNLEDNRPIIIPIVIPGAVGVGVITSRPQYTTFIVKNPDGELHAVRHDKDGFKESILAIVGDNEDLAAEINAGTLKFKDMKAIVLRYNGRR